MCIRDKFAAEKPRSSTSTPWATTTPTITPTRHHTANIHSKHSSRHSSQRSQRSRRRGLRAPQPPQPNTTIHTTCTPSLPTPVQQHINTPTTPTPPAHPPQQPTPRKLTHHSTKTATTTHHRNYPIHTHTPTPLPNLHNHRPHTNNPRSTTEDTYSGNTDTSAAWCCIPFPPQSLPLWPVQLLFQRLKYYFQPLNERVLQLG